MSGVTEHMRSFGTIPFAVWKEVCDAIKKHTTTAGTYGPLTMDGPPGEGGGRFNRGFDPPLRFPEGDGVPLWNTAGLTYTATLAATREMAKYGISHDTLVHAHVCGDWGCTPKEFRKVSLESYRDAQRHHQARPGEMVLPQSFQTWYKFHNSLFVVMTSWMYKDYPPVLTIELRPDLI